MRKVRRPRNNALDKEIDPKVVYNVLRSVIPQNEARDLAGYSPSTKLTKLNDFGDTIGQIRERVQTDPKFGFIKQLEFYAEMRDNGEVAASDRISAAKQLDVIAGNNAPQKVEVNERRTLVSAVKILHQIKNETGMTPIEFRNAVNAEVVDCEDLL